MPARRIVTPELQLRVDQTLTKISMHLARGHYQQAHACVDEFEREQLASRLTNARESADLMPIGRDGR